VGRCFLERYEHVEAVRLEGRGLTFERRGEALYQQTYADRGVAWLEMARDVVLDHRSGRVGLHLVKLTGSAFRGFVRDEYTTLPEAVDRPLFVTLTCTGVTGTSSTASRAKRCATFSSPPSTTSSPSRSSILPMRWGSAC